VDAELLGAGKLWHPFSHCAFTDCVRSDFHYFAPSGFTTAGRNTKNPRNGPYPYSTPSSPVTFNGLTSPVRKYIRKASWTSGGQVWGMASSCWVMGLILHELALTTLQLVKYLGCFWMLPKRLIEVNAEPMHPKGILAGANVLPPL
jgi:hypothetical protein